MVAAARQCRIAVHWFVVQTRRAETPGPDTLPNTTRSHPVRKIIVSAPESFELE
jgi:hypothetical protein